MDYRNKSGNDNFLKVRQVFPNAAGIAKKDPGLSDMRAGVQFGQSGD
jgi:hypothetical protein